MQDRWVRFAALGWLQKPAGYSNGRLRAEDEFFNASISSRVRGKSFCLKRGLLCRQGQRLRQLLARLLTEHVEVTGRFFQRIRRGKVCKPVRVQLHNRSSTERGKNLPCGSAVQGIGR